MESYRHSSTPSSVFIAININLSLTINKKEDSLKLTNFLLKKKLCDNLIKYVEVKMYT